MGTETALVQAVLLDGFNRINDGVAEVIAGLSDDDLLWQPEPDSNSIAWLAWHLTRQEDLQLAQIANIEEVWTAQGWVEKFDLPYSKDAIGYGQTSDEVGEFTLKDSSLLSSYQAATCQLATDLVKRLEPADYERVIDTNWDPPVTVAVRVYSVLEDCAKHLGQAEYLRGMLDDK